MKMGRVDFQGEVNRGCRGHGGVNKGKDGNGVKHNEGGKIKHGDRQRETAKEIITKCIAFIFPFIRRSLCCWL